MLPTDFDLHGLFTDELPTAGALSPGIARDEAPPPRARAPIAGRLDGGCLARTRKRGNDECARRWLLALRVDWRFSYP